MLAIVHDTKQWQMIIELCVIAQIDFHYKRFHIDKGINSDLSVNR